LRHPGDVGPMIAAGQAGCLVTGAQ
jgi:hypothetical protein